VSIKNPVLVFQVFRRRRARGQRADENRKVREPSARRAVALAQAGGCLFMAGAEASPTFDSSRPDTLALNLAHY